VTSLRTAGRMLRDRVEAVGASGQKPGWQPDEW
jgi:hypothetical protein